jgi:predicted MFS family arabinose efflux permease
MVACVSLHKMSSSALSPSGLAVSAFAAFAAFGAFWGVWGASVPRIRQQTGIDDAQLGIALLFVGAGALPAMLLTGRALDRWGLRVAVMVLSGLAAAGIAVALTAASLVSLCLGLALVGATSGATDVAMNAMAGRAEQLSGRPIITRAHGVFSSFVVLASLAAGATSAASAPVVAPFVGVAGLSIVAGLLLVRAVPLRPPGEHDPPDARTAALRPRHTGTVALRPSATGTVPLVLIGILGALAFASENAHQSWGAVFMEDELRTGSGLSAIAPAVFAAIVAVTRFSMGAITPARARTVLLVGSASAAAGAGIVAIAPSVAVAVFGLALAAAGTAVLFPTLVGIVSRNVAESHRGRATSLVTTVAYLGFLLGPVYVGLWAQTAGLRGAMLAVAGLGLLLVGLVPPLLPRPALNRARRVQPR